MRMRKPGRAAAITIILSLIVLPSLSGQTRRSDLLRVHSPRLNSLGGRHPSLVDELSVLQTNPAGLSTVEPMYQYAALSTNMTGPLFSLISLSVEARDEGGTDYFEDEDVLDQIRNINAVSETVGPLGFGFVGNGIGYSVHNVTGVGLTSPTSDRLRLAIGERLVLRGGYAFNIPLRARLPMTLDAGLSVGTFVQGEIAEEFPLIELADTLDDFGPGLVLDAPFTLRSGFGLNLGVLWTLADRLSVGLTADNVYAPTVATEYESAQAFLDSQDAVSGPEAELVPVEVNLGVGYDVPLGRLGAYIDDLDVYASYFDGFDFLTRDNPRNPLLKFGVGAEMRILDILRLRGGFAQGLLAAGLGLQLGVVDVNGAVYGRELSSEPGINSVYNIGFSVDFRQ